MLDEIPGQHRQLVLDELSGRLSSQSRGAPIQNPLSYLAKLCRTVNDGTFQQISAGLRMMESRRQAKTHERMLTERKPLPVSASDVAACTLAQKLLKIRDRQQQKSSKSSTTPASTTTRSAMATTATAAGE